MWVLTSDSKPTQSGYYFTYYYNEPLDAWFYKALWYDVKTSKWTGPWRWAYSLGPTEIINGQEFRRISYKGLVVDKFDNDSRTDYYTQCEYVPG